MRHHDVALARPTSQLLQGAESESPSPQSPDGEQVPVGAGPQGDRFDTAARPPKPGRQVQREDLRPPPIATGDLLLFLDQDDEVGPGYVSAMVSALGGAELVAARMDDHKLNDGWRRQGRTLPQTTGLPSDPVPWAYGCTLGMRRSTFERLG